MLSNGPVNLVKSLNSCQDEILSDFFDRYIAADLKLFVQLSPPEDQVVFAFLVFATYFQTEPQFLNLLNAVFPASHESADCVEQNNYLRNKLINLCSLCHDSVDINHSLFQWIFDKRLADSPNSSPLKRSMVRNSLLKLIQVEMLECGFTYTLCLESEKVIHLLNSLAPSQTIESDLPVRRKLFF